MMEVKHPEPEEEEEEEILEEERPEDVPLLQHNILEGPSLQRQCILPGIRHLRRVKHSAVLKVSSAMMLTRHYTLY